MAIDGTVFNTPDTQANAQAFGRSSNQYGKGAYPQVRCVLLVECGTHATVGLEINAYDVVSGSWHAPVAQVDRAKHTAARGCRHHRGGFF